MKTIILIFLTFFSISNTTAQVGALDNTFGVNGNAVQICPPDYYDSGLFSVKLSDNSYILFGNQLSHYTADGNLDLTYGVNGYKPLISNFFGFPKQQADGKIMMAGNFNGVTANCALARIDSNGTPDPNFGTNGVSVFSGLQKFNFMDISPDQSIVSSAVMFGGHSFKIYKALPNGSLDTSFGTNGIVDTKVYPSGTDNYVLGGLNVQQDGKIVVSGYVTHYDVGSSIATYGMFVVRYLVNGSLDPTFGTNGISIYSDHLFGSTVQIIQPDGKIVIAGGSNYESINIMRFLPNGSLDNTFGNNGFMINTLPNTNTLEPHNILLQPDGKIVLVGESRNATTPLTYNFLIARYTTAGVLDSSFNTSGYNLVQINNLNYTHYNSVYLQPDLKLVAIGNGYNNSTNLYSTVFSRYNSGLLEAEGFSMSEVGVYPNPSEGVYNIDLINSTIDYNTLNVFNLLGELVLTKTLTPKDLNQIDLSGFNSGCYIARISNDSNIINFKLIKK